tara:strand:- start:235 stop:390 length:156 start_codon:yes stop_codon:yes gene_type:complete
LFSALSEAVVQDQNKSVAVQKESVTDQSTIPETEEFYESERDVNVSETKIE